MFLNRFFRKPAPSTTHPGSPTPASHWKRNCALGCGTMILLMVALVIVLVLILGRIPKSYPLTKAPIPPPATNSTLGGGLDGFDSPYIGHTGSWNGKGGGMGGSSKIPDLDAERNMGLRWTFMATYWRALEPTGPVDPDQLTPPEWLALDAFVKAAHDRKLNILMQAPVVGGNAGGPPDWAGRREKGKSAPTNMDALVEFTAKLVKRYAPGGTLAQREGWSTNYGVRAWELDNEPEMYFTHWEGQAADYAEFVTKAAARIKALDPLAVIVGPGMSASKDSPAWLEAALNAPALAGSPTLRAQGKGWSIGPSLDVVSFHNYEGMDSSFSGTPRTICQIFDDVRQIMETWEQRVPGFTYARKTEYWHTEGNFDFFGILSAQRRAAWRFQFYTRAFSAGIRKVIVMDASEPEQKAMRNYVSALPNPFPMLSASNEIKIIQGQAFAFRHPEGPETNAGQVWILWAPAGTEAAEVEIPIHHQTITKLFVDGTSETTTNSGGILRLHLSADVKMSPPVIVIDH